MPHPPIPIMCTRRPTYCEGGTAGAVSDADTDEAVVRKADAIEIADSGAGILDRAMHLAMMLPGGPGDDNQRGEAQSRSQTDADSHHG